MHTARATRDRVRATSPASLLRCGYGLADARAEDGDRGVISVQILPSVAGPVCHPPSRPLPPLPAAETLDSPNPTAYRSDLLLGLGSKRTGNRSAGDVVAAQGAGYRRSRQFRCSCRYAVSVSSSRCATSFAHTHTAQGGNSRCVGPGGSSIGSCRYIVPEHPIATHGLLGMSSISEVFAPSMSSIRNRVTPALLNWWPHWGHAPACGDTSPLQAGHRVVVVTMAYGLHCIVDQRRPLAAAPIHSHSSLSSTVTRMTGPRTVIYS